MNISQQVIILSAELSDKSQEENQARTIRLGGMLEDINLTFNKAIVVYKGGKELCFVVIPKNKSEINAVKNFAFDNFNQESILHQDSNGMSYLIFADGTEEKIGRLKEINPKLIEKIDNYTVLNNRVYSTEAV